MNKKNFLDEIFEELVEEYETEKMLRNGGFVKRLTASEFLGGLKNV